MCPLCPPRSGTTTALSPQSTRRRQSSSRLTLPSHLLLRTIPIVLATVMSTVVAAVEKISAGSSRVQADDRTRNISPVEGAEEQETTIAFAPIIVAALEAPSHIQSFTDPVCLRLVTQFFGVKTARAIKASQDGTGGELTLDLDSRLVASTGLAPQE